MTKRDQDDQFTPAGDEAVALAYDPADRDLPKVTAKGRGEMAAELIRLALEHHIPIKYDPDLVQVLSRLEEGQDLPEEVYLVVAEILAFVYWVNHNIFGDPENPNGENP
jgi:flagellar biosynthesis protein